MTPRRTVFSCGLRPSRFPVRMTKLILMHKADSIYEDVPESHYDFPRTYLKAVEEAVGDWVI